VYRKLIKLIFFLLYISIIPCFPRDITVYVKDTDLNLPLEGAVVRNWDSSEYICDKNGEVFLQIPGDIQVTIYASYPGYGTGRIVIPLEGEYFTIAQDLFTVLQGRELIVEVYRDDF